MKPAVQLVQVNYAYGSNVFLPYSVGMLQAYALSQPDLASSYEFLTPLFLRRPVAEVVASLPSLRVLGLSCYIWNWEYCKALGAAVKAAQPSCLVVLGGTQVPHAFKGFARQHPWADALVFYEGEKVFAGLLRELLHESPQLEQVPGLVLLRYGEEIVTTPTGRIQDLGELPSPYLAGVFDPILGDYPALSFQASQETHRGCLAFGTRIVTRGGEKSIQDITPRTEVLGWNEEAQRLVWNRIQRCVFSGIKPVLRLTGAGLDITATHDHPFYTKNGWRNAVDLRIGDEVLQGVWQRMPSPADNLLTRMRQASEAFVASRAKKACHTSLSRLWPTSSMEDWQDCTKNVFQRVYEFSDQPWKKRRPEPGEKAFGSQADFPDPEDAITCVVRCLKSTPSRRENSLLSSARLRSKSLRETLTDFSTRTRSAFSLCRLWRFLDWSMRFRKVSQSGFRSYRKEARDTGSRNLLASRFQLSRSRSSRLLEPRLEDVDSLGERNFEHFFSFESSEVRWVRLEHIQEAGEEPVFDLIEAFPYPNFFANGVLVHNCPYTCTFCDWGSATMNKVRQFSSERITSEYQWFASHNIDLLYNCDANYGLFPRDVDLTQALVACKQQHGLPTKFRAAYAKNSNQRVFEIARLLNTEGMCKGVTLSFQSIDSHTLGLIKRQNMAVNNFAELMKLYRDALIPTYTELILGLPGETYDSFANGINTLLEAGQHEGLNIYHAMLLSNSEMSKPEYIAQHGIKSVRTELLLLHGTREVNDLAEFYDIVVETATLPRADWIRASLFAYVVQAFHCLNLTREVAEAAHARGISYREFYERLIQFASRGSSKLSEELEAVAELLRSASLTGSSFDFADRSFGNLMWPVEEILFLRLLRSRDLWIDDLARFVKYWLQLDGDFITAQLASTRHPSDDGFDWPTFAREVVWYGRKGGSMKKKVIA